MWVRSQVVLIITFVIITNKSIVSILSFATKREENDHIPQFKGPILSKLSSPVYWNPPVTYPESFMICCILQHLLAEGALCDVKAGISTF